MKRGFVQSPRPFSLGVNGTHHTHPIFWNVSSRIHGVLIVIDAARSPCLTLRASKRHNDVSALPKHFDLHGAFDAVAVQN
jgi:hypothetical protein